MHILCFIKMAACVSTRRTQQKKLQLKTPHWKFIETLNWKPERTSLCFVTHIKKGPCTLMVGLRLKKQNKRDKRVSLRCCCVAVSPQRAAVVVFNQTLQVWPRGSALVQLVW